MIAVATLGCTRKKNDLYSWKTLMHLEGDYQLYVNYELQAIDWANLQEEDDSLVQLAKELVVEKPDHLTVDIDSWCWSSLWRKRPQFDQDQARLSSIVCARNMCIEYAMQTDASHLLFIDADIVPPLDVIPKLLEVFDDTGYTTVCGMVYGRGCHSGNPYLFGEKRRYSPTGKYQLVEVEHANIGYAMISRRAFEQVRFRYGTSEYPDGRNHMISDDPAFHLDCFVKFGHWTAVRQDCVGQHMGDLEQQAVSQF